MSEPAFAEQPAEAAENRQEPMSFGRILAETGRLYRAHGPAFTRPLLVPVLQIYLGGYACILFSFQLIDRMTAQDPLFVSRHPVLAFGSVGLVCLVTMGLFCRGFWQYMLYWASLNLNAVEAIEGRPVDFTAARNAVGAKANAYAVLLVSYCLVPVLAAVPFWICNALGTRADLNVQMLLAVLGLILSAGAGLLVFIGLLFLSFIFQVAAFESVTANPLPVFRRSARLVWAMFWPVTGLQVILYIVTNYAVPFPLWWLVRLLHADAPLNGLNRWLVERYLDWAVLPPQWAMMAETVTRDIPGFAQGMTAMLLMTAVVSLLLPLGTFAFTLAYRQAIRK